MSAVRVCAGAGGRALLSEDLRIIVMSSQQSQDLLTTRPKSCFIVSADAQGPVSPGLLCLLGSWFLLLYYIKPVIKPGSLSSNSQVLKRF